MKIESFQGTCGLPEVSSATSKIKKIRVDLGPDRSFIIFDAIEGSEIGRTHSLLIETAGGQPLIMPLGTGPSDNLMSNLREFPLLDFNLEINLEGPEAARTRFSLEGKILVLKENIDGETTNGRVITAPRTIISGDGVITFFEATVREPRQKPQFHLAYQSRGYQW